MRKVKKNFRFLSDCRKSGTGDEMKFEILLGILFTLLTRHRSSARELAETYGVSTRTIYRYIDEMTVAGVPIDVRRGQDGGIFLSDAYSLPRGFFTREEYARAIDAMTAMNEQLRDDALSSAIAKLSAQSKREKRNPLSGNILVDGGTWGDERKFSDKLSVLERAIEEREALEIEYVDRGGEQTRRTILPHLLVLKQNVWYVYAYCRLREEFRLFKAGRMRTIVKTGETFEKIPFDREQIPLNFRYGERIDALFEISPAALPLAEEWLGVENIRTRDGKFYAEAELPDDEGLVGKILSLGAGLKVLRPAELKERVKEEAKKISEG